MTFARGVLGVSALIWAAFAVWLFVDPTRLSGVGIPADNPAARAEVRAFYGGLEAGVALFLAWSARRPGRYRAGLMLALAAVAGCGIARLTGIALERGDVPSIQWIFAGIELTAALLTAAALRTLPAEPADGAP